MQMYLVTIHAIIYLHIKMNDTELKWNRKLETWTSMQAIGGGICGGNGVWAVRNKERHTLEGGSIMGKHVALSMNMECPETRGTTREE